MAKVIYERSTTNTFFDCFLSGKYFIYDDRLYLKISDHSAFDFERGTFTPFAQTTAVLLKDENEIEIKVN